MRHIQNGNIVYSDRCYNAAADVTVLASQTLKVDDDKNTLLYIYLQKCVW